MYIDENVHTVVGIKYFTSYARWRPEEHKRHQRYIRALLTTKVEIIFGRFKKKNIKCKICEKEFSKHEEKETDVNIAVHMIDAAHNLDAVEARIRKSFGNREIIVGLDYDVFELEKYSIKNADIHQKLKELRDPHNYFEKWYNFIAERENFVPSPILISDNDQTEQILRLADLNRGVVIRINARMQNGYRPEHISAITNCPNIDNLLIIIDLGTIQKNYLTLENYFAELINNLAKQFTSSRFSICGSSFPNSFKGVPSQRIYEFDLFKRVDEQVITANRPLIYSDYASARATRIDGGSGQKIPPRIDIMQDNQWLFFRPDEGGYPMAAKLAYEALDKKSSWGAGLIKSTMLDEKHKIISNQSIASRVRINIHLHEILSTGIDFRPSEKNIVSDNL